MVINDRYVLGSGGMAREILEYYSNLTELGQINGFIVQKTLQDPEPITGLPVYDQSFLDSRDIHKTLLINGIGSPVRKNWIEAIEKKDFKFESLLHPSSIIGKSVQMETGVIVCPNVVLTSNIIIGKFCIINVSATISHDVNVGAYSTIGPGAHIAGKVSIGESVFIGIGVTIRPGVHIGSNTFIGAGSVVVSDVAENSLSYGNPSREIRQLSNADWLTLI